VAFPHIQSLLSIVIAAATYAGVPKNITGIWEKEMIQQTKQLRENARRPVATAKARSAMPKRTPKS
jgi:hypothetical protein